MRPRLFIDLSDLIIYAANFDQISGIQRVEIEFIKLIFEHHPSIGIIHAFDVDSTKLKTIIQRFLGDEKRLLFELNKEFLYCNAGPKHRKRKSPVMFFKMVARDVSRFLKFRLPPVEAGDLVFVPGGFSFDRFRMTFYQKMIDKGVRLAFLVHDVLPITQSEFVAGGSNSVFAPAFRLPAEIITTTHFNVADFARAYQIATQARCPVAPEVVPLAHEFPGVPRNAPAPEPSQRIAEVLRGRPFVLCVGTVEIRKNHLVLLQTWRVLKQDYGDALPLLVIAGRRGWKAEAALAILDGAVEHNDPFVFIEGPSDEDLKYLYAASLFSVFPSLFEGWGLPVGESLWFGKACAASNTSSIPEVGRDLCVYFNPSDAEDMKSAIRQLLDPGIRKTYEDKIHAADLRTWTDVARDLIPKLLKFAGVR